MLGTVMNKGGLENHSYMHGISCISIVKSSTPSERYKDQDNKRLLIDEKVMAKEKIVKDTYSSSSSSSIGNNSDISGNSIENLDDADEVQSSYKTPLDSMEALEEVLPIRRGISGFYKGKSKSFASLADASLVKELSKPENSYAKRRRNLLAYSLSWDKNRHIPLKSNNCGISKRVTNSSRTTLALGVAMNKNENLNGKCESISRTPLLSRFHPRIRELQGVGSSLPRGNFSAWRSFSLADLQECDSGIAKASVESDILIELNPSC